jgi:hypothetical protein
MHSGASYPDTRSGARPPVHRWCVLLFPGGPGKTWSAADFTSLMNDLGSGCSISSPTRRGFPGHGKDFTLGAERPHLAEWRERGW